MIRAHKIRLRPTEEQEGHLKRAFAASRNAWNFGKEILDSEYNINRVAYRESGENYKFTSLTKNDEKTGQKSIKALYNKIKPDWIRDKTATATQSAFDDLNKAVGRYFDIRAGKIKLNLKCLPNGSIKPRRDYRHHGWLNWRNIRDDNSFRVTYPPLKFEGPYIRYNAKVGYIRMCEALRFEGEIKNATFSYDGQWFWASIQVEIEKLEKIEKNPEAIGLDLGIKYLATGSGPITPDGEKNIENPKAYYQLQGKLRRLQRKSDRQRRANNPDCFNPDGTAKKGKRPREKSKRMEQTQAEINKLHARIRNIRRNAQHHLTAAVANDYGLIALEDLNVSGMLKNHKLAKSISDAGFGEIRRQVEYKADYHGGDVVIVDRWFPSSKLCSGCGEKKLDLSLSDREWTCDHCGQQNERDLNAAINLKNEGVKLFQTP